MAVQRTKIEVKRVYEKPEPDEGTRVLVDRLWPRGLSKEKARVDVWLKEVAPSNELRKWFNHDPEKFAEFRRRYEDELKSGAGQEALARLRGLAKNGPITLVFAAHDGEHSNAAVLYSLLMRER